MIDNIFSERSHKWNEMLEKCLECKGYNQKSFANTLSDKYRTDGKLFNQSDVSNWMNVGMERKGKASIGFPKFENMLRIANCLGVDIGYLIGEIDTETFTLKQASDFLHLEPEALNNLKRIIEKEQNRFVEPNEYTYSTVLNKLLYSKYFESLVESLNDLEEVYIRYKGKVPNFSELNENDLDNTYLNHLIAELSDKYGKIIFEQAWENRDITCAEDPFEFTAEEHEAKEEFSNIPEYFSDLLMRTKSNWRNIREKSLLLLKEADSFANKYGEDFFKTIWSIDIEHLDLTQERRRDIYHFYEVRHQFNLFLKKGYEYLNLQYPVSFNMDSIISLIREIELISNKYSADVLENAWTFHKICEAIKDINNAFDKSYGFSDSLKRDMGYSRYSVQEKLVLLLNNIYPSPNNPHNNF